MSGFNHQLGARADLYGASSGRRFVRSLAESRGGIYDPVAMNLDPKALVLGGCFALAGLSGCGSGLDGVDKRLHAMQDEITKMQNQNDHLVERIDAMEARQARAESTVKPAATGAGASERPSLKVVKVVPEDTSGMPSPQVGTPPPGDAADDPSPRPVIKLRGSTGKGSEKGEGKGEG